MAEFLVGQRVRVVDENSPHYERVGEVEAVTFDHGDFLYGVTFDSVMNLMLPPMGRFKRHEIETLREEAKEH